MTTWVIFGLILAAGFFAVRYAVRKAKKGECVGCPGCGRDGGCHCHCDGHTAAHKSD